MELNMVYNAEKNHLIIPEYGRNIQMMLELARTITNDEERQAYVEKVVELIQQMHPQTRNIEDYLSKLWTHVFQVAGFDLKVTSPVPINEEDIHERPTRMSYPKSNAEYKHYGSNVIAMIEKACAMEDEEKRLAFAKIIGSYIKQTNDSTERDGVSDAMIKDDIERLSNGLLVLEEEDKLTAPKSFKRPQNSNHSKRKNFKASNFNRNSSNSNNSNNRNNKNSNRNNNFKKKGK